MIDFHAHIDLYSSPQKVVEEIINSRMYVLSVTTTPSAWQGTFSISKSCSRIKTAIGLHPQLAHERSSELSLFDLYINETDYVGEIGLDFSPDFKTHKDIQLHVFEHILDICERTGGKVLSIHSRRAANNVMDSLDKYPACGIPILHWFSGSNKELERAIDRGCWFSIGPAMLNSKMAFEILNKIPKDRILTESDGPFARFDGKCVMPWDVTKVFPYLAKIWGINDEEAEKKIFRNFEYLLSIK